jgi:hypothetical protein
VSLRRKQVDDYEQKNRASAEIILASPDRYAGLPLEWARRVLGREPGRQTAGEPEQLELFRPDVAGGEAR